MRQFIEHINAMKLHLLFIQNQPKYSLSNSDNEKTLDFDGLFREYIHKFLDILGPFITQIINNV